MGGGLEFALAGDLIVVSDTTVLGFPEVSLGIIPAAGGTQRMALRSSLGVARKWVLTAEKFSAAEALADGVVDFVFHTPDFDAKLEWLTGNLLANAPRSLRQAKQALNHFSRTMLSAGLDAELAAYEPLVPTEDRREALRAFAENRRPKWEGK